MQQERGVGEHRRIRNQTFVSGLIPGYATSEEKQSETSARPRPPSNRLDQKGRTVQEGRTLIGHIALKREKRQNGESLWKEAGFPKLLL